MSENISTTAGAEAVASAGEDGTARPGRSASGTPTDEVPLEVRTAGEGPPDVDDIPGRDYGRVEPRVWIVGGVMVLIGIVTTILLVQDFRSRSYLYLAFYAIPANAAISVFPHEPALVYFGKFANIWIAAGAATAGTIVAAYMDHTVFTPILNLEGRQAYKEKKFYRKAARYFLKYPFATLVVTAATPIPFWPFKFLSFSVHYPLRRYIAAVALARYPRYVVLAWVGSTLLVDVPTWILAALFGAIVLVYMAQALPRFLERWKERRGPGPDGAEPGLEETGS